MNASFTTDPGSEPESQYQPMDPFKISSPFNMADSREVEL